MKAAIEVINGMVAGGVIGKYAIGGAVGAVFHGEAVFTEDVDFFLSFDHLDQNCLDPLSGIYNHLRHLGYLPINEHLSIEGTKVQFLPAFDPLHREALQSAIETSVYGVKTWVMSAEHLMAIALTVGRGKDIARIESFIELQKFDRDRLREILGRFDLTKKWESRFSHKFPL